MAASRQNRVPDNSDATNAGWLVQLSIVAVVPVVNIPPKGGAQKRRHLKNKSHQHRHRLCPLGEQRWAAYLALTIAMFVLNLAMSPTKRRLVRDRAV